MKAAEKWLRTFEDMDATHLVDVPVWKSLYVMREPSNPEVACDCGSDFVGWMRRETWQQIRSHFSGPVNGGYYWFKG